MQVHDLLDDRHAEPRAGRLGRVEGQKDLLAVLGLDADAVVRDLDHPRGLALVQPHLHSPAPLALGRLERVLHDVGEHLSEALAVDRRDHRVLEPVRHDAHAPRSAIGGARLDDWRQNAAERVLLAVQAGLAGVVEQVRDDRLDLRDSGRDGLGHLLRDPPVVHRARGQEVGRHLDAAERVTDLVRDAGRHLAEGGELLALDEALLGRDLLREVAKHSDGSEHLSLLVENAGDGEVRREASTGAGEPLHGPAPGPAVRHRALDGRADATPVGLVEHVEARQWAGGRVAAEQPAARRVERDEPPLDVGRENAVLHRLHHGGEEPLALPKRALHGLERLDELLRLALRDREPVLDDVTGCGGTERGRQHALEADTQVEEVGQRQLARRLAAEQLAEDRVGILGGDVQVQEALDLRHRQDRGRRRRLGLLDEPDERRGLAALVGVLGGEDGYQEVGGDVDEERPEDAVADRVEPLEREERGRAEPADAERAGLQQRDRHRAILHDGGDDQRVEPQGKPRGDARQGALAVAAAPVQAEEHGGSALRDRDERQEPHFDEEERARLDTRPQKAEGHHHEDAEARGREARRVHFLEPPAAEEER